MSFATSILLRRLATIIAVSAPIVAHAAEAPAGWELAYDFAVQDVCVDHNDRPLVGISPADGTGKCPSHRNLRIGEKLPYHKQDWPSKEQAAAHPHGYQRQDDYPWSTRLFGTVVIQERINLGKDADEESEGGGLEIFSDRTFASGLTEAHAGIKYFYGPRCGSSDWRDKIADSWVFVGRDFQLDRSGSLVSRITRNLEQCPDRLSHSYTAWFTRPASFVVGSGGNQHQATFVTLISNHFGGRSIDKAGDLERFYFTRELGLVRWERWESLGRRGEQGVDRPKMAQDLASSGRCAPIEGAPAKDGNWVMTRCRHWTNIVPPENAEGDPANTWVNHLMSVPETRDLVAPR
ncbi:MAG TPA: hypothetical protein VHE81_00395 [Lacipirellulaceae bacterium]|nr:hypothetical protein [Lacipirellulaceae bacterium]